MAYHDERPWHEKRRTHRARPAVALGWVLVVGLVVALAVVEVRAAAIIVGLALVYHDHLAHWQVGGSTKKPIDAPAKVTQSVAMDEGWAAVISAAAGLAGAALGAIGGYVSGRAQARATVEGVQLQLSGQRADALWQAEIDACALFLDACNQALFKQAHLLALRQQNSEERQRERADQLMIELQEISKEVTLREIALLLRMPSTEAERAAAVVTALSDAAESVLRWLSVARNGGQAESEQEYGDAKAKMATYGRLLRQFTVTAQQRFSNLNTRLGGAGPWRRSLFRRRA